MPLIHCQEPFIMRKRERMPPSGLCFGAIPRFFLPSFFPLFDISVPHRECVYGCQTTARGVPASHSGSAVTTFRWSVLLTYDGSVLA